MIEELAPAKINLALHVTGQRPDGYHLLDSLVTFADKGDRLTFEPAAVDAFAITGRFAGSLPTDAVPGTGNLVLRARDLLREHLGSRGQPAPAVRITLEKNLPVASGIGGGSADAAATLRGLARLWQAEAAGSDLSALALRLGADVPMCLVSRPLVARGIGEELELVADFPRLHLLLVNPLVGVSTPAIFKALKNKTNPLLELPGEGANRDDWLAALVNARNDLQPPAEAVEGRITEVLGLIAATGPVFARMSGSGATCFGVYPDAEACRAARSRLETERPGWYFEETFTV